MDHRGDRIDAGYDVGTNTAALSTVNALLHSMVSAHTFLTFPSPESVRT